MAARTPKSLAEVAHAASRRHFATGTANRVDTHVYIGGYEWAADEANLRNNNIKAVVKMFADDGSYYGGAVRHPGVRYCVIAAEDTPAYDIRPGLQEAIRFVQDAVARGERVLVHCHAGVSRSSSVVLLYLQLAKNMKLSEALAYLKSIRPIVQPNEGFMDHLMATDQRLQRLRGAAPSR